MQLDSDLNNVEIEGNLIYIKKPFQQLKLGCLIVGPPHDEVCN